MANNAFKDSDFSGPVTIGDGSSGAGYTLIRGTTTTSAGFYLGSGTAALGTARRWNVIATDNITGSGDAGYNFKLNAYNDSGTFIDAPLTITRAAGGEALFARPLRTTGALTASGGTVTAGVAATTRGQLTARSGSGGAAPGCVVLYSKGGTAYYFFATDAGVLRVHTSAPTADSDGSAV